MNTMKHKSTTTVSNGVATKLLLVALALLAAVATPISLTRNAFADKYDDQINALNAEISEYQAQAAALNQKAKTLQDELTQLAAQKAMIQAQIDLSQAKYDKLVQEIANTEKQITDNKAALGQTIADMYVEGSISPLEMLASSNNIGDYVDQQENRDTVKSTLTQTIARINELKKQLQEQQKSVKQVLDDQTAQRQLLSAKEAEQQKLLADTQGQESAYQALMSDRTAKVNSLHEQQAAEMRAAAAASGAASIGPSATSGGGYPDIWAYAEQDSLVDNWGLYNRECVSYTAWKVASTGRYVPHFGGAGNANQWPSTTARYGIQSGYTPKAGSVAIWNIGYYGHSMYVERVNSDGTITVSDYNNNADGLGWGRYHYYTRSAAGLTYIYF